MGWKSKEIQFYKRRLEEFKELWNERSYNLERGKNIRKFYSQLRYCIIELKRIRSLAEFESKYYNEAIELLDVTFKNGKMYYNV